MNTGESFIIPYGGSELWISRLDGFDMESHLVIDKLLKDEEKLLKPSSPSLVVYHLYGTHIALELAETLFINLIRLQDKIQKLAIVGLSTKDKAILTKYFKTQSSMLKLCHQYFEDFELAKAWLIKGK